MAGQVLTSSSRFEDEDVVLEQAFRPPFAGSAQFLLAREVLVVQQEQPKPALEVKQQQPAKKPRKSRKKPKQGGWPKTRCLTHDQFKQARADAFSLHHMGYRWTVAVHLMPPSYLADAAKQRWISKKLADLGQELERHGLLDVRMSALEKKGHGGKLHGHALVSVPVEYFSIVEQWADRFDRKPNKLASGPSVEIYARVIDNVRGAILYMLKQHEHAGPFEKLRRGPRIAAGDPIKGQRLSRSKPVLAILEAAEQRSANRKAQIMPSPVEEQQPVEVSVSTQVSTPAPVEIAALVQEQEQPPQIEVTKQQPVEIAAAPLLRLVVSNPEPEQLGLAFDAPAINVFALVEAKRRRMGISQREVAAELGLKQPGYANILRGHDKPSRWVTQRALDFLNDSKIAA